MTKMRTQYFIFHIFVLGIFFIIADYVSALAKPAQLIDIRSHYHYEDQKTRIVLEFNQKVDYDKNVDSDQITLQIPDTVAVSKVKSKISVDASNPILAEKIELKELAENKLQLTFSFRPTVKPEIFMLPEPNRIVIDLHQTEETDSIPSKPKELEDSLPAPSPEFQKEKNELLKSELNSILTQLVNIRSHYHHEERKTRVVLEFNRKIVYKEDVDSNYVTLHVSDTEIHSSVKLKKTVEVSNSILIKDIKLVELPGNQLKLVLLCHASVKSEIFTLAQPDRIVIDLLQAKETDFTSPKPAELTTFSVESQSSLPTDLNQDSKESPTAKPEVSSKSPEIVPSVIEDENRGTQETDPPTLAADDDEISKSTELVPLQPESQSSLFSEFELEEEQEKVLDVKDQLEKESAKNSKDASNPKSNLSIFPRGDNNKDQIQKDPRIRNIPPPVVVQVEAVYDLSQPLTLKQCIEIAKKNSSVIKNAKIGAKIEELRVKNAQALYYPDLFLNGGYSASKQVDFGFERNNYSFGVTGRYTIWDHGQRNIGLLQAQENKNLVNVQNDQVRQNLVFQVTQAYYEVLKAQELVEVDEQILDRSRENRERVEAYVEAGIQIEADIATAQVREANSELTLLNDQNQLDIALASLPRIMGLNPAARIHVIETKEPKNKVKTVDISLDEAINHAIKARSEFMLNKSSIKQTEYALRLAKLNRFPRLNAQYNHDFNLDDYFDDTEDLGHLRYWRFAATLDFPIFDGGITKRRVDELKLQLDRTQEDLEDLKRSVTLEVQQAYLNLIRAAKAVEISDAQVRDARLSLNVIRERFIQELAILIELLDAQTEFAKALTSQVRIFYDYQIAQASLQKVLGDL
ncbi:MAG: TolC family protein [Candidatus Poribacteria bacterium]